MPILNYTTTIDPGRTAGDTLYSRLTHDPKLMLGM